MTVKRGGGETTRSSGNGIQTYSTKHKRNAILVKLETWTTVGGQKKKPHQREENPLEFIIYYTTVIHAIFAPSNFRPFLCSPAKNRRFCLFFWQVWDSAILHKFTSHHLVEFLWKKVAWDFFSTSFDRTYRQPTRSDIECIKSLLNVGVLFYHSLLTICQKYFVFLHSLQVEKAVSFSWRAACATKGQPLIVCGISWFPC